MWMSLFSIRSVLGPSCSDASFPVRAFVFNTCCPDFTARDLRIPHVFISCGVNQLLEER